MQPYQGSRGRDDVRKPSDAARAAGGAGAAQRCETLRTRIQEQQTRLASLPPDTHEAECCRRHIRFFEAQLRELEQALSG